MTFIERLIAAEHLVKVLYKLHLAPQDWMYQHSFSYGTQTPYSCTTVFAHHTEDLIDHFTEKHA